MYECQTSVTERKIIDWLEASWQFSDQSDIKLSRKTHSMHIELKKDTFKMQDSQCMGVLPVSLNKKEERKNWPEGH